jgi:1,4-dihydroxy-2-naphthoate octaprenyltransferase
MSATGNSGRSRRWRTWVDAARPRTLPAAVAPVLVGSGLARHAGGLDAGAAGLCLAFALLVQIGTNLANDYYDFIRGADTAERVGPQRAVSAGLVTPRTMGWAAAGVFTFAFVVGLGLLAHGGPWLLVIGAASIVCGIAYTGGPYPLGYHGLGDLFVFLFFGLVAVGATYFVQTGRLAAEVLPAAAAVGLLTANILVVNNYRDLETDAVAGKRTLVVIFGRRFARGQFGLSLLAAFAAPLVYWAWGYRLGCLLPLVLAPLAWRHWRRLCAARRPPELIVLLGDTAKLLAAYALLFALGVTL